MNYPICPQCYLCKQWNRYLFYKHGHCYSDKFIFVGSILNKDIPDDTLNYKGSTLAHDKTTFIITTGENFGCIHFEPKEETLQDKLKKHGIKNKKEKPKNLNKVFHF